MARTVFFWSLFRFRALAMSSNRVAAAGCPVGASISPSLFFLPPLPRARTKLAHKTPATNIFFMMIPLRPLLHASLSPATPDSAGDGWRKEDARKQLDRFGGFGSLPGFQPPHYSFEYQDVHSGHLEL